VNGVVGWSARYFCAVHCYSLDGAALFSKVDLNKLCHNVHNEVTLICAKFGKDLFNISKVIDRKTKWPCFFSPTLYAVAHKNITTRETQFIEILHTVPK